MLAVRSIQTSASVKDVETAAKFIGAGAATVGCAGNVINLPRFNTYEKNLVRYMGPRIWNCLPNEKSIHKFKFNSLNT